ncbi:BTAD domain-containing putative transcriptional regulator [Nonomuraea sp. NPDC005692]|uniref:ATP-binding protein n=1 Tax=Nonomuraea sp. NPDC005692 TaxID=3157168 RepID=UPI0033E41F21
MGESLTLLLLGPPDLAVGGAPVGLRSAKSRALLCYLATTTGPRSRSELAALLWGERPDANARGSLRLALSELRREVGGWLDITRDHVRFLGDGDGCFVDHRQLTAASTVTQALRLWRGEFLDGVCIGDAPAFAGWLAEERGRLRTVLRDLLTQAGADGSAQVVRLARIVAALDPFDEEAHRLLMASLAGAGNRAAALACYDDLRHRLAAELGVAPAPETRALRRDLLPRRTAAATAGAGRAALPVPGSELVGRADEVRRVRALVARRRLVTLVGPGGVGKTRLAVAAAAVRDGREVAFVSFVGVRPEAAVTTLARRLGVDLSPPRPALDLLLSALAGRRLLLVLDNLEHLPCFDAVVGEILRAAPGVRVLATSRRRPDLPGQVAVEVAGLPGPAAEELFAARAVRAQPSFDPDAEAAMVAAICAATCGFPLAIELAAGLLRAVPCAELARRLGVDLELLSAGGPAVRPRHACMRTVFETSWSLLGPPERAALAALSVFGGGCTLPHALEVTGTTPRVLVRLVDQSMLHLTPAGRYAVHPLVQQFAAARLAEDPATRDAVRGRHAACFARLLDRHAAALQDASDTEAVRVLGADLDNIRTAWAASGDPAFLDHYWTLCLRLRLYEESAAVVGRRLESGVDVPYLRARWLRMAGISAYQLAREGEAARLARAALTALGEPLPTGPTGPDTGPLSATIPTVPAVSGGSVVGVPAAVRRAGLVVGGLAAAVRQAVHRVVPPRRTDAAGPEAAQALTLLARLAYHQQDLPTMLVASLRQLNAAERAPDPALRAEAYANFATIARIAGRHGLAAHYGGLADRALDGVPHPTEAASRARLARGLDQLHSGAFGAARRSFAEGRARTLDPRMAENCAGMLAETALWEGKFAEAAELFAETEELSVTRVGGDDIGRHWCLTGRAEALLRLDGVPAERIGEVLAAARASTERRRALAARLGLHDSPSLHTIQALRLLTATTRLTTATTPPHQPTPTRTAATPALRTTPVPTTATSVDRLAPTPAGAPLNRPATTCAIPATLTVQATPTLSAFPAASGAAGAAGLEVRVALGGPTSAAGPGGAAGPANPAGPAVPVMVDVAEVRRVLVRALALADGLPSAQPGMLECWSGLAELLWHVRDHVDRATARRLHTHLTRYLARNPGAAARIGWARALVLAAAGRRRAAVRAAEQALAAADRLAVAYDRRRAADLIRHLTPDPPTT